MELKFTKSSDTKHKVVLESSLVYAEWTQQTAFAGFHAGFEIGTLCVGDGAPVKIIVKDEKGNAICRTEGVIFRNRCRGAVMIPSATKPQEMIYFEAQLPKHGLKGDSFRIIVLPEIKVSGLHWGVDVARRGDFVPIAADLRHAIDGTELVVVIYEKDPGGAHDKVVEIPARAKSEKLNLVWEFVFREDTSDIAPDSEMRKYGGNYHAPEYFFTIKILQTEIGRKQESGLLKFKDHLDLAVVYSDGTPLSQRKIKIDLPDSSNREDVLDNDGRIHVDHVPPGPYIVSIQDEQP
jgi:hypothetical protein